MNEPEEERTLVLKLRGETWVHRTRFGRDPEATKASMRTVMDWMQSVVVNFSAEDRSAMCLAYLRACLAIVSAGTDPNELVVEVP